MINAKLKGKEGAYVVLGFVGEGVGQVRGVCVSVVGGDARAYPLQDIIFEPLGLSLPADDKNHGPALTGVIIAEMADVPNEIYGKVPMPGDLDPSLPPWRQKNKKN